MGIKISTYSFQIISKFMFKMHISRSLAPVNFIWTFIHEHIKRLIDTGLKFRSKIDRWPTHVHNRLNVVRALNTIAKISEVYHPIRRQHIEVQRNNCSNLPINFTFVYDLVFGILLFYLIPWIGKPIFKLKSNDPSFINCGFRWKTKFDYIGTRYVEMTRIARTHWFIKCIKRAGSLNEREKSVRE